MLSLHPTSTTSRSFGFLRPERSDLNELWPIQSRFLHSVNPRLSSAKVGVMRSASFGRAQLCTQAFPSPAFGSIRVFSHRLHPFRRGSQMPQIHPRSLSGSQPHLSDAMSEPTGAETLEEPEHRGIEFISGPNSTPLLEHLRQHLPRHLLQSPWLQVQALARTCSQETMQEGGMVKSKALPHTRLEPRRQPDSQRPFPPNNETFNAMEQACGGTRGEAARRAARLGAEQPAQRLGTGCRGSCCLLLRLGPPRPESCSRKRSAPT